MVCCVHLDANGVSPRASVDGRSHGAKRLSEYDVGATVHQPEGLSVSLHGHSSRRSLGGNLLKFDTHGQAEFAHTDRPDAFCMICHGFSLGSSRAYVILASPVAPS
jgi:hypothetical protein